MLTSIPSPLYRAITLALLTVSVAGCQSGAALTTQSKPLIDATKSMHGTAMRDANYRDKVLANTQAYDNLFDDDSNPSADLRARQRLLKSIKQHMTTDHVAVSQMRHHTTPFIQQDSVDALSDSLLRTVFELFAKKLADDKDHEEDDYRYDEEDYLPPYRNEDSYLSEPDALYLSYIDEQQGSTPTPDYAIDRRTGMSEEFVAITDNVMRYIDEANECLIDYSYELDALVEADDQLLGSSDKLSAPKQDYQQCLQARHADYADSINVATGYQQQYLQQYDYCITQFDERIDDILSPSRKITSIDYDSYDSIYQSYDVCYTAVSNRYELEPSYYLYFEYSKSLLQYKSGQVVCADRVDKQQSELAAQGISYANDPQAYADIYYDFAACDAEAYNHAYYPDSEQSSTAEAAGDDQWSDDAATEIEEYEEYEEPSAATEPTEAEESQYSGIVHKLFNWFKRTPEQIQAANVYNYQYLTLNSISEYNASRKQIKSIYSYDFASPTMLSSMQLPIALDFNAGQVTLDPSALMPVVAMLSPEHAPLPEEMSANTVYFDMPEQMKTQLPPHVVYDIFIESLQLSMNDLDSSYFTAIDISEDSFAQQIGAARAIKVNFGSKQTGELVGSLIKHMSKALDEYVDAHPEQFPDESALKMSIFLKKSLLSDVILMTGMELQRFH